MRISFYIGKHVSFQVLGGKYMRFSYHTLPACVLQSSLVLQPVEDVGKLTDKVA